MEMFKVLRLKSSTTSLIWVASVLHAGGTSASHAVVSSMSGSMFGLAEHLKEKIRSDL